METDSVINTSSGEDVNNIPILLIPVPLTDKELMYHSWHMDNAIRASQMSHCVRRKVGATIVQDGHTISTGWNGMPEGFDNICEIDDGSTTNPLVRHAERNAMERFMSRSELSTGGTMYVTTCPCLDCAVTIKTRAKLARVYFGEFYRTFDGVKYLLSHNVDVFQFSGKEMYKCKLM